MTSAIARASEAISLAGISHPTSGDDTTYLDVTVAPDTNNPTSVPEPFTASLLGLGLVGAGFARRKGRKKPAA